MKFRESLVGLMEAIDAGRPVVFTALVETRGSTPQKAGATMLVFADGTQIGTLGGGCVEAEVKRNAIAALAQGGTQLLTFQLDSDYGWDDGLICGGRMKMLVDPIRPGEDVSYYRTVAKLLATGRACTEAVIVEGDKSRGTEGDRFLLDEGSRLVAQRGRCGVPPEGLAARLRPVLARPRPYVEAGISFLPCLKRCRLVVVGAGHVGQKVAELAADADFDVTVVDDREEYCNAARFPSAKQRIVGPIDTTLPGLEIDADTYCLIVTRGHNHDEEALFHLAQRGACYVGLIGSKRKIKMIFEDLLGQGVTAEALRAVHAPLGVDIGSQTVPEIAISIVAELIAHRNLGGIPEPYRRASLMDEVGYASA